MGNGETKAYLAKENWQGKPEWKQMSKPASKSDEKANWINSDDKK